MKGHRRQPGETARDYLARLSRVALALLVEPGDKQLAELISLIGVTDVVQTAQRGGLPPGLAERVASRLEGANPYRLAEQALRRAERLGVRVITPADQEWPQPLADLARISRTGADPIARNTYPPLCLWLRGPHKLDQVAHRSVAVVGARACTPYGSSIAAEFGYGLAQRGWHVVSGGAFGIDAAAHRGALAAGGGTVAVLACGIDRPYPASHIALFEQIAESGLLVSEWPPAAAPHRQRFLIRNRVIAALTRGTVVVEAGLRSGARFTLHRARDLGRATLAVPGPVTSAMSAGCHEELRQEGTVLVGNVEQIIEAVGRIGDDLAPVPHGPSDPRDCLEPLQLQVLDGVRPRKVLTPEEIAVAAGTSPRDARRALPALELAGFVVADGAGYRLARRATDPHAAGVDA